MSGTTTTALPWLVIAQAARHPDVMDIAYISCAAVASMVAHAGGGVIPGDQDGTTYTTAQITARIALAIKVISQKVDPHTLTVGLLQVPEVAAAVASNPSDPPGQLLTVDLIAAWTRNWTDYAALIAALG